MADVVISLAISLTEKVATLLSNEVHYTFGNTVDEIKSSLKQMQAHLRDAERVESGQEAMKVLTEQIRDVALDIEDALDEFMTHAPRHNFNHALIPMAYMAGHYTKHWVSLHGIQSKMQKIRTRISTLQESPTFVELNKRNFSGQLDHDVGTSWQQGLAPEILQDDEILGRDDLIARIVDQLINNDQMKNRAVAVVGPNGSGKTVLVNNIFRSQTIQSQFECFAWINVPPRITNNFCQTLMTSFLQWGKTEQEISLCELRNRVNGKKYIVVADDIRNQQQWEWIERTLPKEHNGSRIIVTTSDSELADSCATSTDHVHQIQELSGDDSWNLFSRKAFRKNNKKCPCDLIDIAQMIVKKCEGIPGNIVAAGNFLSRKRFSPKEWEKVHDNLGSELEFNKLNQSYMDLSGNEKSCFLYFSIFPEDWAVSCTRLIRLWVAEGFVEKIGQKTLEDTAEDYLNKLIKRNLVQPCKRDSDGRVRSCRVHNLVREFAIRKSQEENFVAVMTESSDTSTNAWEKLRRLSIHNFHFESNKFSTRANLNYVRTLSAFDFSDEVSSDLTVITGKCELLRVLDLQCAPMSQIPKSIVRVTLLRYLNLRGTNVKEVPTCIEELSYLECLDLKYTNVTKIPKGVCKLHNMRHLLVCGKKETKYNNFNDIQGADLLGSIGDLQNLQNLTLVKARHNEFLNDLGKLMQLQKLGLIEIQKEDGKHLCKSIEKMRYLLLLNLRSASKDEYLYLDYMDKFPSNLQHLYLQGRLQKLPRWINESLNSVVRIQLKWSCLEESPIEVLQTLPNLEELQMVEAFLGEILLFVQGSFEKLKTLHIERFLCLDTIQVYPGAMPQLQKLTIVNCKNLTSLPYGIDNLASLKELVADDMPLEFTSRLSRRTEDRVFTTDAEGSLICSNHS